MVPITNASTQLLISEPSEGFMFNFEDRLLGGVIVASPFIFMQLCIVAPGLSREEDRHPLRLFRDAAFLSGAWFAHTYVSGLPVFFASFAVSLVYSPSATPSPDVKMAGARYCVPDADPRVLPGADGHRLREVLLQKGVYAILGIFIIAGSPARAPT
jgi:hypothetical protein